VGLDPGAPLPPPQTRQQSLQVAIDSHASETQQTELGLRELEQSIATQETDVNMREHELGTSRTRMGWGVLNNFFSPYPKSLLLALHPSSPLLFLLFSIGTV